MRGTHSFHTVLYRFFGLEAIASRLEAMASRLEAIATLEAIASRLEAMANTDGGYPF